MLQYPGINMFRYQGIRILKHPYRVNHAFLKLRYSGCPVIGVPLYIPLFRPLPKVFCGEASTLSSIGGVDGALAADADGTCWNG